MDNPVTGGSSWDKTIAVPAILPGGKKHEFYKERLDLRAEFLDDLQVGLFGTTIPIIFRQFHEHTGSWFWWGKGNCAEDEYISIWPFTVNYRRDVKKVHPVLYSYSTE